MELEFVKPFKSCKILDSIANIEQGSAMVQFAYLKGPLGTYAG